MADSTTHTKYGGADQRDYLQATPANVILFAGYGFAKDYRQARGHVHAIEDVTATKRVNEKTPATCWTCKSPDVPRMMDKLGGPEKFYALKFADLKTEITHPIGCLDCHEPNTMKLRITRPALREAFERQGKDIDQASHQEMRTLVCAQCHVEYYFKGKGNYLTFPWDKGTTPEQMEQYFDEADFADWTNAISKAKMVKMRHPDYEVYSTGVHAYRNIACADCHMPYRTEGGVKFTDHHLQSPLLNIANSCAVCHRWSEEEIRRRVEGIQDKVHEARGWTESMIARAHFDIAAAMQAGAERRGAGRRSQAGAPRPIALGLRGGQQRHGLPLAAGVRCGFWPPRSTWPASAASSAPAFSPSTASRKPVEYPDFSTKEKAQALIKPFVDGKPPKLL